MGEMVVAGVGVAEILLYHLKRGINKEFIDPVEALDARNLPRWISDGKKLLSDLKSASVEARRKGWETVGTKREKAGNAHLVRQIARLHSCIEDCLEPMEEALSRARHSGRSYIWNPERRSTRHLQILRHQAEGTIANSEDYPDIWTASLPEHEAALPSASGSGDRPVDPKARIIEALLNEEKFPVICIWGKSGIDTTDLAQEVYMDRAIAYHFKAKSWVSINSKDFQANQVLQEILLALTPERSRKGMYEIELTHESFNVQKKKKCLIVLDNIYTEQDWESIRAAFPIGDSISKIVITTPSKELADQVDSSGGLVCETIPLTQEECSLMVRKMSTDDFDDQALLDVGEAIFHLCKGSSLLARILEYALRHETPEDQLLYELHSLRNRKATDGGESHALDLIYDRLPNESKECLLYMGQFPQGQDIQVEKLYFLLAAEDIAISPDHGTSGSRKTTSIDSVREIFLNFHDKRLGVVQEDNVDPGITKSFRLHDQIRDFCVSQGLLESLFSIVDCKGGEHPSWSPYRLVMYVGNYEDATNTKFRIPYLNKRRICSLLIFDTNESEQKSWPPEMRDLEKFLFLRVLDFDGVDFRVLKFPKGIDRLVLLRYLSFQGCYLETFPYPMSNFPCLETLDLRVHTNCKLIIPNVLHKMIRLAHLFFPMAYQSADSDKLLLQGLEKLEILVNFDTGVCNVDDLRGMYSIKILTVISQGNSKDWDAVIQFSDERAAMANMQLSVDIRNFNCYEGESIPAFKKLLESDCVRSVKVEGPIIQSPENVKFSSNITEMVLNGSELEDDHLLNLLGDIAWLGSLVLSNDAYMASKITFSGKSKFNVLKILKILNLQNMEVIKFEGELMNLDTLVIDDCPALTMVLIPIKMDKMLKLGHGRNGNVYSVKPVPTITDD